MRGNGAETERRTATVGMVIAMLALVIMIDVGNRHVVRMRDEFDPCMAVLMSARELLEPASGPTR